MYKATCIEFSIRRSDQYCRKFYQRI